jgi:hypothetical protein
MNVLIVTQYFWPEYFRVNDLAIELKKKNINVDVLTGYPNYPKGNIYQEFLNDKNKYNNLKGIPIYRVPVFPRKSGNNLFLILNYLSFFLAGIFIGTYKLRKRKYDYIITFATSPIIVALISIFLSKIKKSKHLIWVLDLWPNVLCDLNILNKENFLYKFFNKLVVYIYKNSDLILCQSIEFKKIINSLDYNLSKKTIYYPSWPEDIQDKKSHEIEDVYDKNFYNILFAGNIGESQNFDYVVTIIKSTKDKKILWHVIGEGRNFEKLRKTKLENSLDNLKLYGLKDFNEIQNYLTQADCLLISLQYKETFNSTIPGKFQTYLKYNKIILGLIGGEVFNLINKYKLGMAFNKENTSYVSSQLVNLKMINLNYKKISYLKKIFSKERAIKKIIFYFKKLKELNNKKELFLIDNINSINFKNNFILSGLNLAFLGFLVKKDLPLNSSIILWPDGFFSKRFFNKKINKIPGRELIKNLTIDKSIIKKIIIIGNVENRIQNYLKKKFELKVESVQLPFGPINSFFKYIPKFSHHDLIILTLPTPKQEQLADYISRFNKFYKIICIGGALNMIVGKERPIPDMLNRFFFAETLWRLQYETKRRLYRLLQTLFYYYFGLINKNFEDYTFNIKNEKF